MAKTAPEDPRLKRVTTICLALPEATREILGKHAGFLVRKKHFAYYVDDHHGDGIIGINCKVLPGDNARLIAADPKGWVGLRLDRGGIDWEEVSELLTHSYLEIAPKRLAAMVEQLR
jgi:hypothetical protein